MFFSYDSRRLQGFLLVLMITIPSHSGGFRQCALRMCFWRLSCFCFAPLGADPRSVSKICLSICCRSIVVFALLCRNLVSQWRVAIVCVCVAIAFRYSVVHFCFAILCCDFVLRLCVAIVLCNLLYKRKAYTSSKTRSSKSPDRRKAWEVLRDGEPKKS